MEHKSEENKDENHAEKEIEFAAKQIEDTLKIENNLEEIKSVDDNAFEPAHGMKDYLEKWREFFDSHKSGDELLNNLKSKATKESFRACGFRSVCWEIFLGCLSNDTNKWTEELTKSRDEYIAIKEKHIFNPHDKSQLQDVQLENPLSQSDDSCWLQYFKNADLKLMIEKDVKRTSPDSNFFHSEEIKTMMTDLLFCYAQEHPSISYQQGMHELLAPIIFVRHFDLESASHAKDLGTLPDIIHTVLKEEFMEHDSYGIFCHLMNATSNWYCVSEPNKEEIDFDDNQELLAFFPTKKHSPSLAITKKLNFIHNNLLANCDVELFHHLNRLEIIPQVYGLRWLRLLFGREFNSLDLLMLWDALFADSRTLDLVEYVFVVMMINIRDGLLASETCSCMKLLMEYPRNVNVQNIIHQARQMKILAAKAATSEIGTQTAAKKDGRFPSFKLDNFFSTMSQKFKNPFTSSSEKALKDSDTSLPSGERAELHRSERVRSQSELDQKKLKKEMLWHEAMALKKQITELQEQRRFCSARLNATINLLLPHGKKDLSDQTEATLDATHKESSVKHNEETHLAIIGLIQVRDILNGSLSMAQVKLQETAPNITE